MIEFKNETIEKIMEAMEKNNIKSKLTQQLRKSLKKLLYRFPFIVRLSGVIL